MSDEIAEFFEGDEAPEEQRCRYIVVEEFEASSAADGGDPLGMRFGFELWADPTRLGDLVPFFMGATRYQVDRRTFERCAVRPNIQIDRSIRGNARESRWALGYWVPEKESVLNRQDVPPEVLSVLAEWSMNPLNASNSHQLSVGPDLYWIVLP
jgi:hypothetical protein